MTLSDADALALLTTPKHLSQKAEALKWQNRVRFHGLTVRDKNASAYWPTFQSWVNGFILVQDKRELFSQLFPFPTPCTDILAEVQDAYMKLFDAVNPHLVIDGADGVESDLLNYLDASGEPDFWPDEAISALVESHEDILLIDLKEAQAGRAQPYLTRVPLDSVISVEFKSDATCEHLAYATSDGKRIVADDHSYRLYENTDAGWMLKGNYPHLLGRCPARKLWDERVPNHTIASASIVDEILSKLDSYAFWHVAYEMFKLYGAFPIYYGVGSISDPAPDPIGVPLNEDGSIDAGYKGACNPNQPSGKSSFVAAGEFWELSAGSDPSVAPVGIVEPSTASLEFQSTDIEAQREKLIQYMTGQGGEVSLSPEAMNEKQVTGNFEDKKNRLLYLSRHLSAARQWSILTIGQLRYGNRLRSIDFSFGTEFYLQTEAELWDGLGKAKLAGAPRTILYEKIQGIESFRLRTGGNPTRSQILMDLEPLVESTIPELQGLIALGLVEPEWVAVKVQFTDLIRKMERTFGVDITQIGVALPYETRIETLKQFLYVNAKYTKPEPVPTGRPVA